MMAGDLQPREGRFGPYVIRQARHLDEQTRDDHDTHTDDYHHDRRAHAQGKDLESASHAFNPWSLGIAAPKMQEQQRAQFGFHFGRAVDLRAVREKLLEGLLRAAAPSPTRRVFRVPEQPILRRLHAAVRSSALELPMIPLPVPGGNVSLILFRHDLSRTRMDDLALASSAQELEAA
jgi:hypothetical protein